MMLMSIRQSVNPLSDQSCTAVKLKKIKKSDPRIFCDSSVLDHFVCALPCGAGGIYADQLYIIPANTHPSTLTLVLTTTTS